MASMEIKQTISDMLFDVTEKLSDEEYKNIMEKIGEQKTYIKIRYMLIKAAVNWCDDCGSSAQIKKSDHNSICQLLKEKNTDDYFDNIHTNCVVEPRLYEDWKNNKDNKSFWPQTYHGDNDELMLVFEFQEL